PGPGIGEGSTSTDPLWNPLAAPARVVEPGRPGWSNMPIDLTPEPHVTELAERVAEFVREVAIPAEPRLLPHEHGPSPELRRELQDAARAAGLLAPHVGADFGGLGLDVRGQATVFEEAGYSLLGP